MTEAMLAELGITPDRVDELQTVPVSRLLAAMAPCRSAKRRPADSGGFSPVVDGKILPTHPFDPVATSISETIPILVGCNTHEQAFMVIRKR